MYSHNMMKLYTARELANMLKVHIRTIHNWDNSGILKAYRTPTNRRYYTESQITDFLKLNNGLIENGQ